MKLIRLLFVVIVGLVLTNITITNRGVDEGVVVTDLNKEIIALQNQNTILKAQVASDGSLGNISSKLTEAGFTETPKIISLQTAASVASR